MSKFSYGIYTFQDNLTIGFYFDSYGCRGFLSPSAGLGLHKTGIGISVGVFLADYNLKGAPDPDKSFLGNSISGGLNLGPIHLNASQSANSNMRPISGYTTYGIGYNFIPSLGAEIDNGKTFLGGPDWTERNLPKFK